MPSWSEVTTALGDSYIPDSFLIKALALVYWIVWFELVASLLVEAVAVVRGRRAGTVPLAGPVQRLAARLVTAASLAPAPVVARPGVGAGHPGLGAGLRPPVGQRRRPPPVLAVSRTVPTGQVIEADDLIVVRVAADAGLRPVPAEATSPPSRTTPPTRRCWWRPCVTRWPAARRRSPGSTPPTPTSLGTTISDVTALITADLDLLAEIDRAPAAFAFALRNLDTLSFESDPWRAST